MNFHNCNYSAHIIWRTILIIILSLHAWYMHACTKTGCLLTCMHTETCCGCRACGHTRYLAASMTTCSTPSQNIQGDVSHPAGAHAGQSA